MIGLSEIILIVIIAIAFLKPEKLPEYVKAMREAFSMVKDTKKEVSNVVKPYQEMSDAITKDVDEIKEGIVHNDNTQSENTEVKQ